ncbi:amino acid adenylation domain-containing protein [Mucilaginibacter sp. RCC_168]|uniref:amino acid adenylation domain-containing protein n=1 Tax=Mucilaginibacter sp. RCC_168 TaxID=3239221 RepID=UPI00352413A0
MDQKNIVTLFEHQVELYSNKTALSDANSQVSYHDLNKRANRLASFLENQSLLKGSIISIMLPNSIDAIVSILGIIKAGHVFLPIDPNYPYERVKGILDNSKSTILISGKGYINYLNRLQWECESIDSVICIDSLNFYEEKEVLNEKMRADLWNYIGEITEDDISGGGWRSGYNGELFSREEMDEYAENIYLKLSPYLNSNIRILEIGCSSGISMFRLAPYVKEYIGIDLSSKIIENTSLEVHRRGLTNIKLYTLAAHELSDLSEKEFDIVILNSVIQNFNGLNYLRKVLSSSIKIMADTGIVFLGDLLDLDSRPLLEHSFLNYKNTNDQGYKNTKIDWSEELFIKRDFLLDLQSEISGIVSVENTEKIGNIVNELTAFRFDSMLQISKSSKINTSSNLKSKNQYDLNDISRCSIHNKQIEILPDDLAYVLYTSGSTGHPKGVMVPHKAVFNYVTWFLTRFAITESDVSILLSQITFDGIYPCIWGTILAGGELRIVDDDSLLDTDTVLNQIIYGGISFIKVTPTFFNMLMDLPNASLLKKAKALRLLLLGGEKVKVNNIEDFFELRDDVTVINHYGPTETTIGVIFHEINKENLQDFIRRPVIGKPINNTRIYILDENLNPVADNIAGEIFIEGLGVSKGYLNDPILTRRQFISNPYQKDISSILYKSGDIGRRLPNGLIEICGRADDQVKIRGYRIELGEIEQAIFEFSGIINTKIVSKTDDEDKVFLIAYFTCTTDIDLEEIKTYLRRRIPEYMIPLYFVRIDYFPLKSSGKININALPDPQNIFLKGDYQPAETAMEVKLLRIWKSILGRNEIGVNNNFFELGGHSLKATRLVTAIYRDLSVEIKLKEVFNAPTIRDLAAIIDGYDKKQMEKILHVQDMEFYACSRGQKGIWVQSQLSDNIKAYTEVGVKIIKGNLDIDVLQQALNMVTYRHESLRTTFKVIDGELKQIITPAEMFSCSISLIEKVIPENEENHITKIISAETNTEFDLERGPLIRASLCQLGDNEYMFILTLHHIISDGRSIDILTEEVAFHYNACLLKTGEELPPLAIQYRDFSTWQNRFLDSTASDKYKRFWRNHLAGEISTLQMPVDFSRPPLKSFKGARHSIIFPNRIKKSLDTTCQHRDGSLFMYLLTGIYILLNRYTGADEIALGIPVSGRNHVDLENQIGLFVNVVPFKMRIPENATAGILFVKLREELLELFEYQSYPFYEIVNDLEIEKDLSRMPVFDVTASFTDTSSRDFNQRKFSDITVLDFINDIVFSKTDIAFDFRLNGNELSLSIDYCTELFKSERIERLADHYINLLDSMLIQADSPIGELNYIGVLEKEQLLYGFNDTKIEMIDKAVFQEKLEEQLEKNAKNIAILGNAEGITYSQAHEIANIIANNLRENHRISRGDVVGLMFNRSPAMLLTLLGVIKSGAAYVPISPDYPSDRAAFILQDSNCKMLILASEFIDRVYENIPTIGYEQLIVKLHDHDSFTPRIINTPEDLVYIMYTSGTTGRPKGVKVSNRSLTNLLLSLSKKFQLGNRDTLLSLSSFTFDISIMELFLPLVNGATVFIATEEHLGNMNGLKNLLKEYRPTVVQATPSIWNMLVKNNWEGANDLVIISGGEYLNKELANKLLALGGELWNMYGPTETTIWSTAKHIKNEEDWGTVGKPIDNTEIYILDKNLQLTPIGVTGSIYISGRGLSAGYINLPELTEKSFLKIPYTDQLAYHTGDLGYWTSEGEIYIRGRGDSQIKLRGVRIELQEIENVLLETGVQAAKCMLTRDSFGEDVITIYYEDKNKTDISKLKMFLQKKLPIVMVPSYFIQMDELPLNVNGKLDQSRLPDPQIFVTEIAGDDKLTLLDKQVLDIISEVLGRKTFSLSNDFFKVGGNSMSAIQLITWIESRLKVKLSIKEIFENSLIKDLVKVIRENTNKHLKPFITSNQSLGPYPLSHIQQRFWTISQSDDASSAYNISSCINISGNLNIPALEKAFELLINKHEILHTEFLWDKEKEDLVQNVFDVNECDFLIEHDNIKGDILLQDEVLRHVDSERSIPFALDKKKYLLKAKLLHLSKDEFILIFTIHHIICDAASLNRIFIELSDLYQMAINNDYSNIKPLAFQFKEYAIWEKSRTELDESKKYWLNQFADQIPILNILKDFPQVQEQTYNGNTIFFDLPPDIVSRIEGLIINRNCTFFMFFISAVTLVFSKYTGQEEIILGVPVTTRIHPDLQEQIGPYINTLAIKSKFRMEDSFLDLLLTVRRNLLDAFSHQEYPFDCLVDELSSKTTVEHAPIFDVMVSLQDVYKNDVSINGGEVTFKSVPINSNKSQLMIAIDLYNKNGEFSVGINYNTDLFKEISMILMKNRLLEIIDQILQSPSKRLNDFYLDNSSYKKELKTASFDY